MSYRRVPAPKDYEPGWIDQELEKIERLLSGVENLRLKERNVEPPKPRLGDVYLADGSNWDPGSGPGMYRFDGSSFVLLGFDGNLAAGSVGTTELADDAVSTAKIQNDAVTFAKMQEIATQRVIGRNTAATGNPEEVTVLQMLNWLANTNRGDLIVRGASDWASFNLGTSGQLLSNDGTDPVWVDRFATSIMDSAISGGASEVVIALSGYDLVVIYLNNLEPSNDAVALNMQYSQDGGSNYLSGVDDYSWLVSRTNTTAVGGSTDTSDSEITLVDTTGNAAGAQVNLVLTLFRPAAASWVKNATWNGHASPSGVRHNLIGNGVLLENSDAITHARIFWSAGTFDVGHVLAVGYKF